jgi:putative AdoMet-dependent methyltransferase
MTSFPDWYFDESQRAGVDFEDAAQVEVHDRNQTASILEQEQALVDRLGIAAKHIGVDLGAGTGNFAIQAALVGAAVHAVDISKAMLAYAQDKAQKSGIMNIQFHSKHLCLFAGHCSTNYWIVQNSQPLTSCTFSTIYDRSSNS